MSLIQHIEDSFYQAITEYVTVPVIIDYQGGPEPVGDYGVISVDILNEERKAESHTKLVDDTLVEVTKESYRGMINIRFYGASSYENALKVRGSMNSRDRAGWFFSNKQIGIQQAGNLRRSPEIRDTGVIQKAIFPVFFFISYEHENEIDWFNEVGVEYSVTGSVNGAVNGSFSVKALTLDEILDIEGVTDQWVISSEKLYELVHEHLPEVMDGYF
jgi:hypothetical protein